MAPFPEVVGGVEHVEGEAAVQRVVAVAAYDEVGQGVAGEDVTMGRAGEEGGRRSLMPSPWSVTYATLLAFQPECGLAVQPPPS